ncbi:glucose-1-phosphate thymidylyltransferase [Patescibacteria group bacterium]|nr:glucose-1-phosphate thymidylyltransferase [Patescibacteria group bacterium]MBU1721734.1 glucose-1-phosphate thymidylyltransferase [Patescibacteria group bacterium]MBU1901427.1 glucose-1-phosphate thymidylyltransferase [Patescibacteria group bacterium]
MKIKKAILTGGGRATRLHPITTTVNKHLLPLANKPMMFHAIEKAIEAGIDQIFINVNPGETELQKYIGDGGHWGITITYFEQTGGPKGIAHVVNQAKEFIGDDPFMFYLSDNVLLGDLTELVDQFHKGKHDCMLALSEVPDPERFGVPVFNDEGILVDIHEKPAEPKSNFAVTGIYLYGPKVFFNAYEHIEPSHRGEYEISSIHSHFLKQGLSVGYKEITGWWKDTGKPKDMLLASALLLDNLDSDAFPHQGDVHPDAHISGKVQIGIGSTIGADVMIEGPVIIAENCELTSCHIGPHVTVGNGTAIYRAHIDNSIILENTTIDMDLHISGSIIGKNVVMKQKQEKKGKEMIIGDKTQIEL